MCTQVIMSKAHVHYAIINAVYGAAQLTSETGSNGPGDAFTTPFDSPAALKPPGGVIYLKRRLTASTIRRSATEMTADRCDPNTPSSPDSSPSLCDSQHLPSPPTLQLPPSALSPCLLAAMTFQCQVCLLPYSSLSPIPPPPLIRCATSASRGPTATGVEQPSPHPCPRPCA